jgi:hypothetical protein
MFTRPLALGSLAAFLLVSACVIKDVNHCPGDKFRGDNPTCDSWYCEHHRSDPQCKGYLDGSVPDGAVTDGSVDGMVADAGDGGPIEKCTKDSECSSAAASHCDLSLGQCVACSASTQCDRFATTPVCAPTHGCVACSDSELGVCAGDTPVCITGSNACVQCNFDLDCKDSTKAKCDGSHQCVPCDDSAQCANVDGKLVCEAGACVECTKDDRSACKTDEGNPAVCNVKTLLCDKTREVGQTGPCVPCVSDAECMPGNACVLQTFSNMDVGFFCLPVLAMPTDLCPRPYLSPRADVVSIEGATVDVCDLGLTTCPAELGAVGYKSNCGVDADGKPVASGAVRGENDLCGQEGLDDGFCVLKGGLGYRCTVPCLADEDCPDGAGVTCKSQTHETGSKQLCTL